jgi:hypothetical protein
MVSNIMGFKSSTSVFIVEETNESDAKLAEFMPDLYQL